MFAKWIAIKDVFNAQAVLCKYVIITASNFSKR